MSKAIPILLSEQILTDNNLPDLPVLISINDKENITIKAKGYADYCSAKGDGYPILIEQASGNLRIVIWGDVNKEDPTHIIELDGAKESNRKE